MPSPKVDTESIDALAQVQDKELVELMMTRQLPLNLVSSEVNKTVATVKSQHLSLPAINAAQLSYSNLRIPDIVL
jgi:hypothetical protein